MSNIIVKFISYCIFSFNLFLNLNFVKNNNALPLISASSDEEASNETTDNSQYESSDTGDEIDTNSNNFIAVQGRVIFENPIINRSNIISSVGSIVPNININQGIIGLNYGLIRHNAPLLTTELINENYTEYNIFIYGAHIRGISIIRGNVYICGEIIVHGIIDFAMNSEITNTSTLNHETVSNNINNERVETDRQKEARLEREAREEQARLANEAEEESKSGIDYLCSALCCRSKN